MGKSQGGTRLKIVIEPHEVHEAVREYVIKRRLLGPGRYKEVYTKFRSDDEYQSFNGEVEVSLTDPEAETEDEK